MSDNKLGLAMMQFGHYVDWVDVAALRPRAILIMDPTHYHAARLAVGEYGIIIWRPTEPVKPLYKFYAPEDWAHYILNAWPHDEWPDLLQWINEPNLEIESGEPDGSRESADRLLEWGTRFVNTWLGVSDVLLLSPPLSPAQPQGNDLEYLSWVAPLVAACDVFAAHCYWATPAGLYDPRWKGGEAYRYQQYHAMFPGMPMVVTECNRPAGGTVGYGQELYDYSRSLDYYVEAACVFVWDSPAPLFQEYVLQGTEAYWRLRVLVEDEGLPQGCECPACGTRLKLEVA